MDKENTKENRLFTFDGRPAFTEVMPLGLQHVVAAVVGIVTPGLMIAKICGLNASDTRLIIQTSLVFSGLATLLQLFPLFRRFGARLPMMMGASFAYVPILLSIGADFGIGAIFGSQLVGSVVVIVIGLFIDKIRILFPPIVTGTVILSIGLSLRSLTSKAAAAPATIMAATRTRAASAMAATPSGWLTPTGQILTARMNVPGRPPMAWILPDWAYRA